MARDREDYENVRRPYGERSRDDHERNFFERAAEKVYSWFGDDTDDDRYDERQRRDFDERRDEYYGRNPGMAREGAPGPLRGRNLEEGVAENYDEGGRFGRQGGFLARESTAFSRDPSRSAETPIDYMDYAAAARANMEPGGIQTPGTSDNSRYYPTGDRYRETKVVRGPNAGRGPKGYSRGDERIREDVCERLTQHGGVDASDVEVRVEGGVVTLTGTVPDRQMKHFAEDTAESVRGVSDVRNELRVARIQP